MTFQTLPSKAGVDKDNSPLEAELGWTDADKVRFVGGLPETIYGWERATTTQLSGICRGAFTYADNARNPIAAFGTHLRLYAMNLDGTVFDITPVVSYAITSAPNLTTTLGSAVVTVSGWTHALVAGQKFSFGGSSPASVGGITVDGAFAVVEVIDATTFTYTAAAAATSDAGPTAIATLVTAYLAPGQIDGLGGLGFGTGGYGSGGYGGGQASLTLYPRTWSLAPWGQNLLASPRGGAIYEWAPDFTSAELVTNGDFTSSVGWSSGVGWSIGAGVATASAGVGSDLTTNVVTQAAAWHLLSVTVTRSAGSLQPKHGGLAIGSAIGATGTYRLPFFTLGGAETITFSKDAAFAGSVDNVSLNVLTTAQIVAGAPTQVGSMFVTAERILVACGSNLDGNFDALQLDWSDAEDNQDWTPTSANLAGGYTLPGGGRVVRGLAGAGENVIWTEDALWSMRYNADPNRVYDFIAKGTGCGLVGPNAAAEVNGVWYWMTPAGAFMAYGGAAPALLPCTLARDVKDNLAFVQQDKVHASKLVGKNYAEVWWFYPDMRDGNECSRYVVFDTIAGTWSCGMFDRTAFTDATVFQYPLAVDTAGAIWFHEKGFTADGAPRSWSLMGAYRGAEGGQIMVNGVRPDHDDLQGGYAISFAAKNRDVRGIFTRSYPGLSITAATGQRSARVQGEQVSIAFAGNGAPTFWRMGNLQFDISLSGRQR
ncbi:MAG: hypothetical protein ACYCZX_04440 [Rhodospirillaceae bacterium]